MKRLLVVDILKPERTHFRNPYNIGAWFLGRNLCNYVLLSIDEENNTSKITLSSNECAEIQNEVLKELT